MSQYLDASGHAALSIAPASLLAELDSVAAGWRTAQLTYWSDWLDARLRKRYAVPFTNPYPPAVPGWLARIVDEASYLKRGIDPTDAQWPIIQERAAEARAEIKEAADSVTGLFELPLADGSQGVKRGTPLVYAEQSPYTWIREQREAAENE